MSSHKIISDSFSTSIALKVMSSRFPIGVETIYKLFKLRFDSKIIVKNTVEIYEKY